MDTKKAAEISLIFMGVSFFIFLLQAFSSFLRPFVIAIILTFLFVPFTRLSSKRKWNIYLGTFGSVFGLVLLIFGIGAVFNDSEVSAENDLGFSDKILEIVKTEHEIFGNTISLSSIVDPEKLRAVFESTFGFFVNSTTTFLSELFIIILFVSFLLPMYDKWILKIADGLKGNDKKGFLNLVRELEVSVKEYLRIKSIVSLGTAGLSFIFMLVFGVKYAMLFAVMIFALNFIPNIGSIAAVAVVLLSHFIDSGFGAGLVILGIVLIIIQIIFGNIVEPKFAGHKFDISPVVILLSLLFWGAIWGIGGMLFSVPLTVMIKIIFRTFYDSK